MGQVSQNQMGKPIPGINPMLETFDTTNQPDGSIMGNQGSRIKEIRKMSGAFINIDDPAPDSCRREITIAKGHGSDMAVANALWLMNIAINAFCDPAGSACPFPGSATMQQVVMSGFYGQPPGMQQQQQQQMMGGM